MRYYDKLSLETSWFSKKMTEALKLHKITINKKYTHHTPVKVFIIFFLPLLFFFAVRIWGKIHWFPACAFFFFLSGDQFVHTNSTVYARIGSQWLSEQRWLWPSVPWWVACELVSLLGSHTMPGQHSQPTPTLLGQGCLDVNCHLHFWQNDWGLLHATVVTWGGTDTK